MKLTLSCPYATYDSNMRIKCEKQNGGLCANQKYRPCKGWCVLTEWAERCPARTAPKRAGRKSSK